MCKKNFIRPMFVFFLFLIGFGFWPVYGQGDDTPSGSNEFTSQWKELNLSEPKQRACENFKNRKYGMFIHWGLYSIPGGIWDGKRMEDGGEGPTVAEWIMRRKEISRVEYAKLADQFNPVKFDAAEWVSIAKAAGMKYIIITSKHHDGFSLFDSQVSDFNAVKATPFGRDIIRELEMACKKAGLAFGVYYSHSLDWRDGGDGGMKDYGPEAHREYQTFPNYFDPSPVSYDDYIASKSLPQVCELIRKYDLSEIWLDTPIYMPPKYSFLFYKTIYAMDPEILVSSRVGNGFGDFDIPGDNVIPDDTKDSCWECIATSNNSWGYNQYDDDWKSPQEMLFWLISTVSKGGNLLMNVGPTGEGVIPEPVVENLYKVGEWLKVNGEAIYGAEPWSVHHEGPTGVEIKGTLDRKNFGFIDRFTSEDFWFTQKNGRIYVMALVYPENGIAMVRSLKNVSITSARLLGGAADVTFEITNDGVQFKLPKDVSFPNGYVLEVF